MDRLSTSRTTTRLGLLLTGDRMSPPEMAHWAAKAELAGFESVWVTEGHWDAVVPLSLMTQTTSRIRLGPACAIVGRQPFPAQLAWAGIDRASQGRLVLGLADGPSGPNASWWGGRPRDPVRRMREHIEVLRGMLGAYTGGGFDYDGEYYTIDDFSRWEQPQREHVPILLGATQPQMLRLAGEVADGYVAAALNSVAHFRDVIRPNLEQGLRTSGRDPSAFEVATLRICSVAETSARAQAVARSTIAFYAGIAPKLAEVLDHEGFSRDRKQLEGEFGVGGAARAAQYVPEPAIERLAIAGTPEECRRQLDEFAAHFDTVILYPPGLGLDKQELEASHQAVIDTFAPKAVALAGG